jgi:hypothetical protein
MMTEFYIFIHPFQSAIVVIWYMKYHSMFQSSCLFTITIIICYDIKNFFICVSHNASIIST